MDGMIIDFNIAALVVVIIVVYLGYRLIKGDSDD
jgi:type IV secretory pathway VirB2 component (pilin)